MTTKNKVLVGVGIGIIAIGGVLFAVFRKKGDEEVIEGDVIDDGRAQDNGHGSADTIGINTVTNIPVVTRPVSSGTSYTEFSMAERISPKPNNEFVFVFTNRQNANFLKVGDGILISGTSGAFDGHKNIEKLWIDGAGKLGGVYLRPNPMPTQALNVIKTILTNNEYALAGKVHISKQV